MDKEEKLKFIVDKLRPYLNRDGGDLEFIKFEEDTAYIDLIGACSDCGFVSIEGDGIKELIEEEVEGIKVLVERR